MTNGPRATAHPTAVLATGSYLPEQIVHNDEVASTTGVTDEWIVRKTGIHERRRAAPHEATSDLAAHAGRRALEQAGIHPHDLAYIVVATSTPDQPQPPPPRWSNTCSARSTPPPSTSTPSAAASSAG